MSIDSKDIEIIAHLARLHLSAEEKQEALQSITSILKLIDRMQAADTSDVDPQSHASEASQRLREDRVTESDQRDILLALAPAAAGGLFQVPKVIE